MIKKDILHTLKDVQIVYGERYTLQGLFLWKDNNKVHDPMKLIKYSVCVNCYEDFDGRQELIPVPIENFELEDIEKAVDRFIKLEKGSK